LSNDTVTEAWCFTPWELVPSLHLIKDGGSTHTHFVDGSPALYYDGTNQYVTFGLRRGGDNYYSIKVGAVDSSGSYTGGYDSPVWAWKVASDILGSEDLGQSWAKPRVSDIATGDTTTVEGQQVKTTNRVLIMPGGYDADNEDKDTPSEGDSKGRAVFAVDASTGELQTKLNFNQSTDDDMDYCIVELVDFDHDNDGMDDTIYAGSLGGNLFALSDRDEDGNWTKTHIFQARSESTADSLLKFFTAADVVLESFGDFVYISTGDRAHPSETDTVNRIYAIKNTWANTWSTLTEEDLVDVTDYTYNSETYASLSAGSGWYIKLSARQGEKVMSSPIVFNKIVFLTTYTPGSGGEEGDKCSVGSLGSGRLYALNYLTGEAAMNFDTTNDTEDNEVLADSDRSRPLGTGIPSPPTLIVSKDGGPRLIIGTGTPDGKITPEVIDIPGGSNVEMYFWKQN